MGKTPKSSWKAMFFLYFIFAMNANGREIINRLSPYIADTFNVTATQIGLLGTLSGVGMVLGCIPLTAFFERGGHGANMKRRLVILSIGYLGAMFLMGIPAITSTFAILVFLQAVRGFFSSPGETCEVSTLAEWWPREKNGFAIGFHHTAYPWGTLIFGAILVAVISLIGEEHWQYSFMLFPIIGLIFWLGFWKFSSKKNYQRMKDECVEAGLHPVEVIVDEDETKEAASSIGELLKNKRLLTSSAVGFLCQFSLVGIMFWLPLYLAYQAGLSFTASGIISMVFTITAGLGQIVWGKLSDTIGVRKTLAICFAHQTVAYVAFALFACNGTGWIIGLQLFLGCCSNAVYPVIYKRAQDSVPDKDNAKALSIITTAIFIGASIATVFTGWLITVGGGYRSASGYNTAVIVMSAIMLLAFIIILVDRKNEERK